MSRVPMGSDGGAWAMDPETNYDTSFVPQGISADLIATIEEFSRDDVEAKMMPEYVAQGLLPGDPFDSIDVDGVGALVRQAVQRGRSVKRRLKIGVCGEHGGDPSSVMFCHTIGLDYVSCSPFRVPIARLAAAQAALKDAK